MSEATDWGQAAWFAGVVVALLVLLAAGLRLPVAIRPAQRLALRSATILGAVIAVFLANIALYRNDAHFDLTHERAFTPSEEARAIVRGLRQPVELFYFYQKQNEAARAAVTTLRLLERESANLLVTIVDIDQRPALANRLGVRIYNTAILLAGQRRAEVVTTDEREIALALLRLTRKPLLVCFATGHGEYDIDNFEFHTHFEGTHSHSHDTQGMALVQMEQHGLGRMRRALEQIGLAVRKQALSAEGGVPSDCSALVQANPRTRFTPPESEALRRYLAGGGAYFLALEPDYPVDESLTAVLAKVGVGLEDGVIIDPLDHYYTDEQMLAVTRYGQHVLTRGLALSFYPAARPVRSLAAQGVRTTALLSSSARSYVALDRLRPTAPTFDSGRGAKSFGLAAEGRLEGGTADFRVVVVGDADFVSNSFFPYLANADFALASLAWLLHEETAPTMKPPVEVLPLVTLTETQVRGIFILTVIVMPGLLALAGLLVWWRRRT